jgi:hypothetical protein
VAFFLIAFLAFSRLACPAMAAEAFYFLLDQKVTKNQVSKDASCAHGLCPAKLIKPRAA